MESSAALISPINKGEIKAFKQFFEDFYPSVFIFARKYLMDSSLAEDIAQEAFIEFWKSNGTFADLRAMKGFIYAVTRNKCLNEIKKRKIRKNILIGEISSDDYFYELILEEETYSILHSPEP